MSTPSLSLRSALPLTRPRTLALHKYLQPATTTATTTRSISTRPPPSLLRIHPGLNPRTNSSTISNISSISQPPKISSFFKSLFGSWGGPSTEEMSAAKIKAENIVKENAVVVFSKSYCPYCKATVALLHEHGASFFILELDQVDDGPAIQDALEEITGQRSVPNIFIKQKHIGGNSELQARKAELPALLKEAGAV